MRLSTLRAIVSSIAGAASLTAAAGAASAQQLHHNDIHGHVRFNNASQPNADPQINALLSQLGMWQLTVRADSTAPTLGLWSLTSATPGSSTDRTYLLSAECDGGVTYEVKATASLYNAAPYQALGRYTFPSVQGVTLLSETDPAGGAHVDIEDCAGIVKIRWAEDAGCLIPATVESGSIQTSSGLSRFWSTSYHYVLMHAGSNEQDTLYTTVGSDPTWDTRTYAQQVQLNPQCNVLQDICIAVPQIPGGGGGGGGGGGAPAGLTGPYEIVGETLAGTVYVDAVNGPDGNRRYGWFPNAQPNQPPPPPPPAIGWTLPNMVEGTYQTLYSTAMVGAGRSTNLLTTASIEAVVPPSGLNDLQQNIGSQHPFVMTPARFEGAIRLVDPYVISHPGSTSVLSALRFGPIVPSGSNGGAAFGGSALTATEAMGGESRSSFDGAFDPTTGELSSSYRLLLVHPYDLPSDWRVAHLGLEFEDAAEHLHGALYLSNDPAMRTVNPGDTVPIDHAYCFNEVVMTYTTAGALFNPVVHIQPGGYTGQDFRSQQVSYQAFGDFSGAPELQSGAAQSGQVRFLLPQGTFDLQPEASIVSGGGSSTASFTPTTVTVGCGQRLDVTPGLSVAAEVPPCALEPKIEVPIAVDSGGAPVDHVWMVVNGATTELCLGSCGGDPTYQPSVVLTACDNTIEVFATSGGQTSSITVQTVWDDPTDGVVCGDGACSQDPVDPGPGEPSDCASVNPKVISCQSGEQGSTGGYELTLEIKNTTSEPIARVLLPDADLSPHSITLASPLQPGATTAVTVTVDGANPGSKECFLVGFNSENDELCCSQQVCVDIPSCCFAVNEEQIGCMSGEPSSFSYSFSMVNHTTDVIEHVFLYPQGGVTVAPDYIDVPSLLPGGVAPIGPLTISGVAPGKEVCLEVGIHNEKMSECCSETICFEAPQPCEEGGGGGEGGKGGGEPQPKGCAIGGGGSDAAPWGAGLLLGLAAALRCARRSRGRGPRRADARSPQ